MSYRDWSNYIAIQEEVATNMCFSVALAEGVTLEQAELCDDGSCGCKNCPWNKHTLPTKDNEQ